MVFEGGGGRLCTPSSEGKRSGARGSLAPFSSSFLVLFFVLLPFRPIG